MIHFNRIDVSEGIVVNKNVHGKSAIIVTTSIS